MNFDEGQKSGFSSSIKLMLKCSNDLIEMSYVVENLFQSTLLITKPADQPVHLLRYRYVIL